LPIWTKATFKSLALPGGVILLASIGLESFSGFNLAPPILTFLFYSGLLGGMILSWRFHSSRVFMLLVVLFLVRQAVLGSSVGQHRIDQSHYAAMQSVLIFLCLNYALIALMHEHGLVVAKLAPICLVLLVECMISFVLWRSGQNTSALEQHGHRQAAPHLVSHFGLFIFITSGALLFVRFLIVRKPIESAFLWSFFTLFLSLNSVGAARAFSLYSATAVWILAISIVESSYLLAYHDELTTLPSRRAFNDALAHLRDPYSIAVVDIDHFKRFNDTYGHDVGDQVLRLVAARLSQVTGGGHAYRCGGEEFTILFPGRTTAEVIDHLEALRRAVEVSEFRVRGDDRRQKPRGADRRKEQPPRKKRRKQIDDVEREVSRRGLSVTISIGLATSTARTIDTDLVLKAADKALYRAKANGRNRLEPTTRKSGNKAQAAGIA
jgi:diguanylate cyclase (GGDEF)-like protein